MTTIVTDYIHLAIHTSYDSIYAASQDGLLLLLLTVTFTVTVTDAFC